MASITLYRSIKASDVVNKNGTVSTNTFETVCSSSATRANLTTQCHSEVSPFSIRLTEKFSVRTVLHLRERFDGQLHEVARSYLELSEVTQTESACGSRKGWKPLDPDNVANDR